MIVRLPALMAFFLMALSVPALAAEDAVTLGIGAPLSGAGAMYGPDVKTGVELAVEDINAQGGVLGKKLKPVFEDDVCDPKTGVVVANRFISMGIDMAAHFCGPACLAAAPVYAEENVLMLTAACSPPQLTSMGLQNIARVYLGNEKQSPALAKLIGGHFAGKKLGFVFSTDSYSQSLADGITEELKKNLWDRS
ncbi:MAG: ABC transporter substrate-binding protein [Alphaproteobacteria bacterium]